MASITIDNLDEGLTVRLTEQAAQHGRSLEDEARDILQAALGAKRANPKNLAASIRAIFAPLGGVELPEIPREAMPPPLKFE